MRNTLRIVIVALLMSPVAASAQTLTRVRVDSADSARLRGRLESLGFDVLYTKDGARSVDVVVSQPELDQLRGLGLAPYKIASGRPLAEVFDGVPSGYSDLANVYARMHAAAAAHPTLCQVVDLTAQYGTPTTFEGRHLFAVKISDNVAQDEGEPAMAVVSGHHAREIVTPVIALEAIDRILDEYGSVPAVTALVDANELWIAPTWNPDGYDHVFVGDNFWRKNRRVVSGGIGVDQNRNYPQGWDNACSGSTSPSSGTYKGERPASEAETQTMLAWARDRRFGKVLDYHSSGREALWGYACEDHPFDAFLRAEATILSTESGYGDERLPSADGEHQQWHSARQGAMAYLIETHVEFQPDYTSALDEASQVYPGLIWMLARPLPITGHVTDAATGQSVAASISLVGVPPIPGEENSSGGPFGRYNAYVPPGPYQLRFEAPGYVTRTEPVTAGDMTETVLDVALDPVCAGGATTYCIAAPNSVGPGAQIAMAGSVSVSANSFQLLGSGLPPAEFGLFIYGENQTQSPLFEGFLCVGNPFVRLPVLQVDSLGAVFMPLDLANPPLPSGQITAGSTWNFQLFYRDVAFGGTRSNLSHGLEIAFCP